MYKLIRHKKPYIRRTMKQKHKTNPVMLKKLAIAFAITIIAVFCYIKIQPHTNEAKQQIQLEHKSQQLKSTRDQLETQKVKDADTQKKLDETNKQLQETQKQLEAKRATATAYAAELSAAPAQAVVHPYQGGGNKEAWMTAAGIPQSDWWAVDWLVSRESGWNPCAYNPGRSDCTSDFTPSTACGLVQTLPCGKAGTNWRDPVAALIWQKNYVCGAKFAPYGGCYSGAVAYWQAHGNY